MAETAELIRLAAAALARGEELLMATVVRVEGSSYRKPGARMLLTSSGARAGTISGGCLEAEVARKAWWLTANGPSLERYSSFFDEDGAMPYGLGCGGTVWVLLERGAAAQATIAALVRVRQTREAAILVTSLGEQPGLREVRMASGEQVYAGSAALVQQAFNSHDVATRISMDDYFVEHLLPPPALFLFGAGDDAKPVVELADTLGWHVVVADGRANLARPERFPLAAEVRVIDYDGNILGDGPEPGPNDMAVLLTHSYEQDLALLSELLPRSLTYLGVLGPQRRTERIITELLPRLSAAGVSTAREEWLRRVRTPVGLDLGGDDPSAIALSIVAELQAVLHGRVVSTRRTGKSESELPAVIAAVEVLGD